MNAVNSHTTPLEDRFISKLMDRLKSVEGVAALILWGADWKQVRSTGSATLYYDTEEITHPSKDIVTVLTKWAYTEKGIKNAKEIFGKNYENLSYSTKSYEINCQDKTSRISSITDYNKDGTVIPSDSKTNPEWSRISQESILDSLYKMVCK